MNVFIAFNDGYTLAYRVMLKSLIMNDPGPLNIYVLYSSLQQQSIDAIKKFEEKDRVRLCFQQVDDTFLDGFSIPEQFSKETYYRLFAHRLFSKEIDRVLWLDGDMIINGSLAEFYNQDFKGKLYVAVENGNKHTNEKKLAQLKMPADSKYVNTGVLLFDLKGIRKELNDQEIVRYLKENQDILSLADQDVFNGLLHDRILVVDPDYSYNFFHWGITDENKSEVCSKARVIHYCGTEKPWKPGYPHLCADLWWKYALLTGPEYKKLYRVNRFSDLRSRLRGRLCQLAKRVLPIPVYNGLKAHNPFRK